MIHKIIPQSKTKQPIEFRPADCLYIQVLTYVYTLLPSFAFYEVGMLNIHHGYSIMSVIGP